MKKGARAESRKGLWLTFLSLGLASTLVVVPSQFRSTATVNSEERASITRSHVTGFDNYDIRTHKNAAPILAGFRTAAGKNESALIAERNKMLAGEQSLRHRIPTLKVESNNLNAPEVIAPEASMSRTMLTGASSGKRSEMLRSFLKENNSLIGVGDKQLNDLKVTADYTNPDGVLSFAHLEQQINGIPVFNGEVKAGFTKQGEIVRIINNLAPGLESGSLSSNFGSAEDAVRNAFKNVRREMKAEDAQLNAAATNNLKATFGEGDWATTAEKMYFPTEAGVARAAWRVLIWENVSAYYVIVDAETGTLLWRKNIVEDQTQAATYNVYANTTSLMKTLDSPAPFTPGPINPGPNEQAPLVPRTDVTLIGNEAPYTFNNNGWITDNANGANGHTDGNAVEAGLDRVAPNGVDAPVAGTNRNFSFTYNPAPGNPAPGENPLTPAYQSGAVTQLFYICNRYHDEMYLLGFTEQARNFQQDNFGRGAAGADRVSAEAQDSSGTNNANFATPADGTRGRMQMYLWTLAAPSRDGDLDADIVIHEFTHGLSNRLHGNGGGLGTTQSRGMGEGWSDWYAHAMLSEPTDPINGTYTTGGYSLFGDPGNYYYGIRHFPKAVIAFTGGPQNRPHNPLTFADIDPAQANVNDGAYPPAFGWSTGAVHDLGEVWSSALWEVRAKYVQRLGWAVGNRKALQHVTDGMKLAPLNPNMLQERDAIIAAAQAGGQAADVADVWAGFALRGMGFSARNTSGSTVVEAFDLPNVVMATGFSFTDLPPGGDGDGFAEPGETLVLNVPVVNNTGETITGVTVQVVGGGNASYGDITNGSTVSRSINYTVPANTPCGSAVTLTFNINSNRGLRTETRVIGIGAPVIGATENFDGVTAPALPAGWTTAVSGTNTPWVTTTTTPDSAPNAAFAQVPATAGGSEIVSPVYNISAASAALNFKVKFDTEAAWDGGVLEIKIGAGVFQDIIAAGGSFAAGGYNGVLGGNGVGNPLAGRAAWTGTQTSYLNVSARLPASVNGQTVQFRWRVGQDDNTAPPANGFWVDSIQVVNSYNCTTTPATVTSRVDFDGDGKTDRAVFRDGSWFALRSQTGFSSQQFGVSGDTPLSGDFDGDNKADLAVVRTVGGNFTFYVLNSQNNSFTAISWGTNGDAPAIGDYNGDGKDDVAVFRPSNGTWYVQPSGGGAPIYFQFGTAGDLTAPADYDGDNKTDFAVFRPSSGTWFVQQSQAGFAAVQWGQNGDKLVSADYDNDNKDDIAVFRNGNWYIRRSSNGQLQSVGFGQAGDVPVPGDYDGDGADDVAVYRGGNWYVIQSSNNQFSAVQFGAATDVAVPSVYTR